VQQTFRVTWRVTPRHAPLLWRNCRTCNASAPFRSSMKFRTNAQKKRLDVWLIYRCDSCSETWNLPIFERVAIGDIAPDRFDAIARNDHALASSYAFDRTRLERHGGRIEDSAEAEVAWLMPPEPPAGVSDLEVAIRLFRPWRSRLDRFAARQLGMTRSRLHQLAAAERLAIAPAARDALRNSVIDGQRLTVRLDPNDLARISAIRNRVMGVATAAACGSCPPDRGR